MRPSLGAGDGPTAGIDRSHEVRPPVRNARAEIVAFFEEYRRATEARDITALARMYVEFADVRRDALERFFSNVRDLRVRIYRPDVAVVGDEAVVTYTRVDDFIDVPTGTRQHVSVRLTRMLRCIDGRWRFGVTR